LVLGRLPKGRQLALLAVSIFVVFWLQPVEPFAKISVSHFGFLLPPNNNWIGMDLDFRARNAYLETKLARPRNPGRNRFVMDLNRHLS